VRWGNVMPFSYVVLGAGHQGLALAYDLAKNCEAGLVRLADVSSAQLDNALARLQAMLPATPCRFEPQICDVSKPAEVAHAMRGADVVISAAPYRFNAKLTEAAIATEASFCDLGGNTGVVRQQLAQHAAADGSGVSVVPDCGLAPGLGNILAAHGVRQMDAPRDVHVRCGGLPEHPVGPLGYKLVFNFDGLVNEYSGHGEFLRDGRRVQVPALTELEQIEFAPPVGKCEAAVTSGGTSTCPDSFAGHLQTYDYKTVRYPGHFAVMRAMFELGLFDADVKLRDGQLISPKPLLRQLMEDRLQFPKIRDLVVLRCTVTGEHHGKPRTIQYDLFDRHDEQTGFTAMERTTAFPTSLVAYMQARRLIAPGARPLEFCLPTEQYMAELARHDIRVTVKEIAA
jgi:lysine 6-dehydrogenase